MRRSTPILLQMRPKSCFKSWSVWGWVGQTHAGQHWAGWLLGAVASHGRRWSPVRQPTRTRAQWVRWLAGLLGLDGSYRPDAHRKWHLPLTEEQQRCTPNVLYADNSVHRPRLCLFSPKSLSLMSLLATAWPGSRHLDDVTHTYKFCKHTHTHTLTECAMFGSLGEFPCLSIHIYCIL